MKKLTLFLVAMLAMVNVANAQRAWAYDLELTPSVDSYTFAFKAVTAGDATLVFYKDGIEAATLNLGSVSAGDNTVTKTLEELLGAIQQSGDFTWGVKMSAGAIALSGTYLTELTAAGQGLDFYLPQGLVVDNNPESETFSTLFIAEAQGGKLSVGPTHKQGIYHYSQKLAELNPTDQGIIPSNVTLTNGSRQEMHRIAINPKNNHVAFAHNISGKPAVWSVPANNPAGEATNLIAGTAITMPNSICFDENGALYVMDNANATTGGTLYKVVDGVATKLVQNKTWQQVDNSLAYDGRGGIWIAQTSTGTTWPSYAILSHVNSNGEIDWSALDHSSEGLFSSGNSYGYSQRGQCAYNVKEDLLVLGGNCRSHIFQVTYNAAGAPSLTLKYRTPFIKASTNIDGAAFDYAGDLYLMSAARERLYKYVVPTTNNTCTVPAKKSQVITLVSATPEYNVTINVNGNGTVTGANTGKYLEGTELTLTATPEEHYDFLNWTYGGETSTDNPLTITVNSDLTVTANFQEHTKYTITAVPNDENMGTVTGGKEYYVGESATLKAIAKSGYVFAGWADGEKNATRTVIVSGDATYTANFQVIAPRAWAYDLKVTENGDKYEFTFKATAAGSATLLFADIDGNELVAPHAVGTVAAGANTVTLTKTTFEGVTKDVYWSVKMDGEAIPAISEITDQSRGIYDFYNMMGVVVDNDPNSDYFGKIYIQQSFEYTSGTTVERNKTQKAGIFIYDQGLNELNNPANTGILPQLPYTLGGDRQNFKRMTINPANGNIAFCNNKTENGGAYSVSRADLTSEAINLTKDIADIKNVNALCFDKDGNLYVVANVVTNYTNGDIYKIAGDGTYIKITPLRPDGKKIWVDEEIAIVSDGRGGIWVAQKRDGITQYSALFHVNFKQSKVDFVLEENQAYSDWFIGTNRRGAIAYDVQRDILAVHGPNVASLFSVAYDGEGVPTITKLLQTPNIGSSNIDGLAFDYAGDLYLVSSGTEKFYKYTLPTDENICTVPAPSSQKLVLGTQCEVTVTVNDPAMGSVEGAGQYEKGAEVTLTPNPVAHHRFVNWTGDKTSTDNPLKFTIEGNVNLTANFEAIPQVTITVTSNDENMGTVTGGGTYDEGQEVTIAANPKATYRFVKWSDDVTDATRTFPAAEDLTLQAIFEKVPNRAWAYDLSQVADGDNYKFSFVATTAGEATLLFADKDGNELVAPYAVGTVAAGANTVTLAKTTFEGVTKDVYWSVKMEGEAIPAVAEITDQAKGIYDFYSMRGVVVDNDPNSTDFGKIYVEMSLNGASDGGSERTKTQTAGIFIYDQQLNELNTPSNKGYKPTLPSGYTELGTAAEAMKRLAIDPSNGNLVFGNNIAGQGSVWTIGRDNLTGTATNIIEGATGINKVNAICYDEKGSLYVLANITLGSSKYNLYKFTDGVQTELTLEGKKIFVDPEVAMASDGRGGIWIAQNRSGIGDYKILSHVNVAEDKLDFVVETGKDYSDWFGGNCYRAAVAYNPNTNVLAVQGINKVSLFSVSYDAAGVPSITKLVQTPTVGKNIDGLAFDYAGDLYVVNSSAEKLFKFTIPTAENICTVPAPSSQKLVLGTQCEVTVTVNDPVMGSVEGAGQYEKGAEVTLTATPNEHYEFVNWTNGTDELSKENPYSFTVQEDVTIIANFAELPTYTITLQANNATMGSVEGGGTVYVGESVEIKAIPNSGHAFVKWDDGNTEATRTVEVDGNKTYTAIFQAMIPRAWAYDLRIVEEGDNYKFTFKATSAGDATLLFTNKEGTPVALNSHDVGAVEAGETSVTIAKSEFGGTEDIYWSVKMDGATIENMVELTDASGSYDFFMPQDVKVDNSPNSMYFGQIYVAAAQDGACRGGNQKRGIFVYNQTLDELNTSNEGYLPVNATLTDVTRNAIHRIAVNPIDGNIVFAYNVSGSSAVWSMNPAAMSGTATNLIAGSAVTAANSVCFDEDGALYVLNNANTSTGGNIYKILNGTADVFANAQNGCTWVNTDNALALDGREGLWIAQNRWAVDGYPVLSHVNASGIVDFAVTSASSDELKAMFPGDALKSASYRGHCAYNVKENILAFAGYNVVTLFKVTYDAAGVPSLEKLMTTPEIGVFIDGVAFDYAGDLYVASASTKRFYKFVVPTNDNTCTVPAPESQIIKKEARYTVTVVENPSEGGIVSVSDGGNAIEGATLEVTATANTGYRFVNWTKDAEEVSTSASFEYTVPAEDVTLTANFEPLPEITYDLNGGVWNKYGWTSKKDMYNALLDDWRAYSGSTRPNVSYEEQLGIGNSSKGIPTTITSVDDRVALMDLFTDATYATKWGWLATYVDFVATTQYKKMDEAQGMKTQPTSGAGVLTYTLGNFFGEDKAHTTDYIDAVDFTGEEAHITEFAPYWGQTFPLPTQPTEEVVLNAPYKEGYEFDGWYANSDFSGAEVTVVDENTDGTLYAKWLEHFYTRTVTSGRYGTICLPYGSSNMTGAIFYEIAWINKSTMRVFMDEVTELEAGKPYIFLPTSSQIKVVYQGEKADEAGDNNGLYGTFTDMADGPAGTVGNKLEGNYMLSNNQIIKCLGNCKLPANRAYFKLDKIPTIEPAPVPGRRRVALDVQGGNEATGVDNLTEDGVVPAMEGTYDVLGRKMNEPKNTGFYIVNGKKVVIVK